LAHVQIVPSIQPVALRLPLAGLARLAPGVALSLVVAGLALASQTVEIRLFGHVWLEPLVLAILIGTAVRSVWSAPAVASPGVCFAAKPVLEAAVMLLGASVSGSTLLAIGWPLLVGIVGIVFAAIAVSYGLGRLLRLPQRMAMLVACGNSICGNSAIAAVAPVIGAEGKDVAAAIAFTAVLGVATVLGLPMIGAALRLDPIHFGILSGLTVYAVPQVLAAAAPAGATAVQMGTLVKLVRVLMLGPVCFVGAMLARRWAAQDPEAAATTMRQPSLWKLIPWFIMGFLTLAALRSAGLLPALVVEISAAASGALTIVAMAALGLSTDLRTVVRAGPRAAVTVTLSLVALGVMSLGLLALL